jgi:hypothetical protein
MARAALISVTPLLEPSLSMSWTSRTRISSLMRGPSLAAGCGVLIGRRMGAISLRCCYTAARVSRPDHRSRGAERRTLKIGSFSVQVNANADRQVDRHGRSDAFDLISATSTSPWGLSIVHGS